MTESEIMPCEHDGCVRVGNPCYTNACDIDGEGPNGYWCPEHSQEAGFCYLCGLFWGGIESFEFGNGLCDNCRDSGDYDDCSYFDEVEL